MTLFWLIILVLLMCLPAARRLYRTLVRAPMRIHSKHRLQASPKYEGTKPEHLTPEMQEFLSRIIPQFRQMGFEVVANIFEPEPVSGVAMCLVLLVNRDTNDIASVPVIRTRISRALVFSIGSEFPDGHRVVTMSSNKVGIFPRDPSQDAARFAWVTEPPILYEAHRRRLARANRAEQPRLAPSPGQEIPFLHQRRRRELDWCVRRGYLYLDSQANVYRYTWKGAFFATWKSAAWIKRWRRQRLDRRMRRLWNQLEMDSWQPQASRIGSGEASIGIVSALPAPAVDSAASDDGFQEPSLSTLPADQTGIQYRSSFAEADFQRNADEGSVAIRLQRPPFASVLGANTPSIVVIAVFLPSVIASAVVSWIFWIKSIYLPVFNPWIVGVYLLLCLWIVVAESRKVFRAFWRLRGTMTAIGNREGVRFEDAPGRRRTGQIPRLEIDRFEIAVESKLFVKLCRLEAKCNNGRQPLFVSTNLPLLQEIARLLLEAMGRTLATPGDSPATTSRGAKN